MGLCSWTWIAQNAGAIIKTLDEKPFLYDKADYKILVYYLNERKT